MAPIARRARRVVVNCMVVDVFGGTVGGGVVGVVFGFVLFCIEGRVWTWESCVIFQRFFEEIGQRMTDNGRTVWFIIRTMKQ
jgi:hypothetical protein